METNRKGAGKTITWFLHALHHYTATNFSLQVLLELFILPFSHWINNIKIAIFLRVFPVSSRHGFSDYMGYFWRVVYSVSKNSDRIAIILTYFHYFRKMSKLLFALPNNGSGLDGYKTHTLTHPKGKPYKFLEKDNKIFEINHLKEKYHSCVQIFFWYLSGQIYFYRAKSVQTKTRWKSGKYLDQISN